MLTQTMTADADKNLLGYEIECFIGFVLLTQQDRARTLARSSGRRRGSRPAFDPLLEILSATVVCGPATPRKLLSNSLAVCTPSHVAPIFMKCPSRALSECPALLLKNHPACFGCTARWYLSEREELRVYSVNERRAR